MILPSGAADDTAIEQEEQTSRTYRIDIDLAPPGMIDGIDAVRQAVTHILNTNRGEYPIYSYDYGFDGSSINVNDRSTFQAELIRRVREALLYDDRITAVDDFRFSYSGDSALVKFIVTSRFGQFATEKVVGQSV